MKSKQQHQNFTENRIDSIMATLRIATHGMPPPMVLSLSQEYGKKPFLILISCLLSLRTRDTTTLPVCHKLFKRAQTPQEILTIPLNELEHLIYPVGFYRKKAEQLQNVSRELLSRFAGKVPSTEEELLSIKGVGRKTAALVLGEAFDIPALCVDTHVHRVSNRLGIVRTKTPEQTERALKQILPHKYWIEWNRLLVVWGQNICVPVSPFCSKCPIYDWCDRVNVKKSR